MEVIDTTNKVSGRKSFQQGNRHTWACMDVASTGDSFFHEWWQCAELIDGSYKNHNRVETFKEAMDFLGGK